MTLYSKGAGPREADPRSAAILAGCGDHNSEITRKIYSAVTVEWLIRRLGLTLSTAANGIRQPVQKGSISAPILTFSERVELISASLEALCRPIPPFEHAALHDIERRAIERVLTEHPDLSGDGFWHWGERQDLEELNFDRLNMTNAKNVDQFRRCLFFLSVYCKRKGDFNRETNSVCLSTIVEATKIDAISDRGKLVSHGMFLAAAIALDYRLERIEGTSSAFLNLEFTDDDA